MYRNLFESRGGVVGQFLVLTFQYRIVNAIPTLAGRLTVQNRSFEAGGLDAIADGLATASEQGDELLAGLYDGQLADEIVHVRFANEYLRGSIEKDRRVVLEMGAALSKASKAFVQVMGAEATEGATCPADRASRLEAGFTNAEIDQAIELATAKMARSSPTPGPE